MLALAVLPHPFGWTLALNGQTVGNLPFIAPELDGPVKPVGQPTVRPVRGGFRVEQRFTSGVLTETIRVAANRWERSAEFRSEGDGKFFRFHFAADPLGFPEDRLTAPGPYWPWNYVRPSSPVADLSAEPLALHSAPDGGFGFLSLEGDHGGLATWLDVAGETNFQPTITRTKTGLRVDVRENRETRLRPGIRVQSGRQIFFAGPREAASAWYRRGVPMDRSAPAWVKQAVILEAYPDYTKGFRGLTQRIPQYAEIGFNTLYLMPHWLGGYMPKDFTVTDPQHGTEKDLQELVQTAQRHGMRVLFDLVIHGTDPASPWVTQFPEFYGRTEAGELALHPTWKSAYTDWAVPEYRRAMADLARYHALTFGIDGYRVDAAGFKGPNWDPQSKTPAYRSGTLSPLVIQEMRDALRETRPEAEMLNEVFGPVFYRVANWSHDNQTEGPTGFLELRASGKVDAEDYRRNLADTFALLPPGANRVFFTRNHDTSWFYRFRGYTPDYFALEAIHAFCGIPEVFGGDPKHGPSPDDDPMTWTKYRRLFAARKAWTGSLKFDSRGNENRRVAVIQRGRHVLAVSLSDEPEAIRLTGFGRRVTVRDIYADTQTIQPSEAGALSLTVPPFAAVVLR